MQQLATNLIFSPKVKRLRVEEEEAEGKRVRFVTDYDGDEGGACTWLFAFQYRHMVF